MKTMQGTCGDESINNKDFVINTFLFGENAYKELYPYSRANATDQLTVRAWGKQFFVFAALFIPVAIFALFVFFRAGSKSADAFYALFPTILVIISVVCGLYTQKEWKRMDWEKASEIIETDFARLKSGKPLIFGSSKQDDWEKFTKGIERLKYSDEIINAPNEVKFSAWLCDEGIFIGEEKNRVVANYRNDIKKTYETDGYFAITLKDADKGDIIFDKKAYVDSTGKRINPKAIKKFIKAKRRRNSQSITLKDYIKTGR